MELVVLGAHGTWPPAGGAASGYLVRHDGYDLWVDAGTGTLAKLQEHIGLFDVGAVAISHQHFDHFVDLYPYYFARWSEPGGRPRLPLFAPPGMFEHALQLEPDLVEVFEPHVVEPGQDFGAGPFRVRTASMRHPVPTMGMRFEADGTSLAYSADTGPTRHLIELARRADLLLSEATLLDATERSPELHLSAAEAGEHASRAEVGRLVLTHIRPTNDMQAMMERVAKTYTNGVTLARSGMKLTI